MSARKEAAAEAVSGGAFVRVGRWLGTPLATDLDAMKLAQRGISVKQYQRVAKRFQLPKTLPASASTLARREDKKEPFNPRESERVLRVLRVLATATQFFGDERKALEWMQRPADFMPGGPDISPMQMATSEIGARHVEGLLRSSAEGFF